MHVISKIKVLICLLRFIDLKLFFIMSAFCKNQFNQTFIHHFIDFTDKFDLTLVQFVFLFHFQINDSLLTIKRVNH